MKGSLILAASLAAAGLPVAVSPQAAEAPFLSVKPGEEGLELSWSASRRLDGEAIERPYFELQSSADLVRWVPIGERMRARSDSPGEKLRHSISPGAVARFYRLLAVTPSTAAKFGEGGAEVFGYAAAFKDELERIGQISPAQFQEMFPSQASYSPGLSWDPTTATFWDAFNADPDVLNANKQPDMPGFRYFDARLNEAEMRLFKQNGFVVSERLGGESFAAVFFKLWHADLPVFISADAVLQAWHRTYDAVLEEAEETQLFSALEGMLAGMAGQLESAAGSIPSSHAVLRESLRDADYFLAVARSLLAGTNQPSVFGQNSLVHETLADIESGELIPVNFMGFCRVIDFSQFKPRGHYTRTERLRRYFRCMMWLGRIDVPVAGEFARCPGGLRKAAPREIGVVAVLWHLLRAAGQFETWRSLEQTIEAFVGPTDSLTFGGLSGLFAAAGIDGLEDLQDTDSLERLRDAIARGELGIQNIRSDWFDAGAGGALPQTFTVLGQKFVPDSWVLSQTVYSSILWDGEAISRRVPGALDVAFAVLGNNQVVPELVAQIEGRFPDVDRPHALTFRDGHFYQHNLAATRTTMDRLAPNAWNGNIYMDWLRTLRTLSAPTTDRQFPEAMRTRAWAMKTLNTQLASWTQLRHDTILYAKQSYTEFNSCLYPTGYVEPRPEFWRALRLMAERTAQVLATVRADGIYPGRLWQPLVVDEKGVQVTPVGWETREIPLTEIRARQVQHLQNFAGIVAKLEILVGKQLQQQCFTAEEEQFIDALMENSAGGGCGPQEYTGWYPALFYRAIYWSEDQFHLEFGAGAFDALVADVHTDVPNDTPPDPGSVLHQGVGRVNLLMMAVENGNDRFVCAGPVLSHYEFEITGGPQRLNDGEWQSVLNGFFPSGFDATRFEGVTPPLWTRSYLVPFQRALE